MNCNFVDDACENKSAICKRCTDCGKTITVPAAISYGWPKIEAEIKRACQTPDEPPKPPARPEKITQIVAPPPKPGVGTALKKLLAKFGIKASGSCKCNTRARIMDENGIAWCENNVPLITTWLQEEANKRRLPFSELAAKMLLNRAIRNAKRAQNER